MTIPAQAQCLELRSQEPTDPLPDVRQAVGRVVAPIREGFAIMLDGERVVARSAASCLLRPRRGDRVLLATLSSGAHYVLAVLEQEDTSSSELRLSGDATIRAEAGDLRLQSASGVEITAADEVEVHARSFNLRAAAASLLVDTLEHFGNRVLADIHRLDTKASVVNSVAERVSMRAKRMYRDIEDLEQARVGQLDITAKNNLRMHAKNALLTALSLVKVDGEQIHMG